MSMSETAGRAQCMAEAASVLAAPVVSMEPLSHARRNTATLEVWRVCTERERAVVKVVSTEPLAAGVPHAERASHPYFVAREPVLYERGLPRAYAEAGIAMPRLLRRIERPGAIALWLEDLEGASASELTVAHYAALARRLGRAQGAAMERDPDTRDIPWSRGFLDVYASTWNDVGWDRIHDDSAWAAPLVRAHFPPELRAELLQLCAEREEMLIRAARLPFTICHHDVWPCNVFDVADHSTLIDWAFAGYGPVGSDPGNLVTDSCGDLLQPAAKLPELDAATTAGYRDGLAEAGWRGDFRFARLGMCLMAGKWAWLVPHMLNLAADEQHAVYGGRSVDSNDLFAERAAMLAFNAELARDGRVLAADLGA
jgi:hypothetical protein